jgi:prevent-host-death family protein
MASTKTISATEFKATCLDLLDRVGAGEWDRLEVTKRGKVVAVVVTPASHRAAVKLHGALRGRVVVPPGLDLTAPTSEEPTDAEVGILHR